MGCLHSFVDEFQVNWSEASRWFLSAWFEKECRFNMVTFIFLSFLDKLHVPYMFHLLSIKGLWQGRLQVCDDLAPDALGHDLCAILGHDTPIEFYFSSGFHA